MSYVGNSPAEIYSSVQKQDLTGVAALVLR